MLTTGSNEKLVRIFDLHQPEASPETFAGHTAGIRHVLFFRNDTYLISCADDKTLRVWDRATKQEVQKVTFPFSPSSLEVSRDGTVITVAYSNKVAFFDADSLNQIGEYTIPSPVNSASLHPDKTIFVAGGDDLKVYKYDYQSGIEIESFKGHFGPVHCLKFSPDGELYASGSEDGTLRLWQTTVGKTYGLWKCVEGAVINENNITPKEVQAN
jgi:serine-threonine kinase receptor-associated protein